jgi:5-methylcytosine-specific restriction endonuclease McrA
MLDKKAASWLKCQLRKISKYWPEKTKVFRRAKVDIGVYKCESCNQRFKRDELQIDHIEPIVGLEGFVSWDEYIERMFCSYEKLQALCRPCHQIKTKKENEIRRKNKELTKLNKKK